MKIPSLLPQLLVPYAATGLMSHGLVFVRDVGVHEYVAAGGGIGFHEHVAAGDGVAVHGHVFGRPIYRDLAFSHELTEIWQGFGLFFTGHTSPGGALWLTNSLRFRPINGKDVRFFHTRVFAFLAFVKFFVLGKS